MSMRIHTTESTAVAVEYATTHRLVDLYGDEFDDVSPALIVEDGGNCEAMVLMGTPEEIRALAHRILNTVNGDTT